MISIFLLIFILLSSISLSFFSCSAFCFFNCWFRYSCNCYLVSWRIWDLLSLAILFIFSRKNCDFCWAKSSCFFTNWFLWITGSDFFFCSAYGFCKISYIKSSFFDDVSYNRNPKIFSILCWPSASAKSF